MPEPLRLWSFRLSPFAGKARVAFAEKGVEVAIVDIKPSARPPRLRELNPLNRIPVLELSGGAAIPESAVICEWLEEVYPDPPLWPADPAARAAGRYWHKYLDDWATRPFFSTMRTLAFGNPDDPQALDAGLREQLESAWLTLEAALAERHGPWLLGGALSYADLAAMALAVRLPEWRADLVPDEHRYPRLTDWFAALSERPSAAAIDRRGEPLSPR